MSVLSTAGVFLAGLAGYVAWRRGTKAALPLAVLLVSVAWWGLAYAVELSVPEIASKGLWGDLKYLGVCALAPSWLVFVLQYTGRAHLVSRRMLAALLVEPVAVLVALFIPATHDLVRFYPPGSATRKLPVVATGPVFWVHLVYANVMILVATLLFVVTMLRLSRTYRVMTLVLVSAALLPWVANLLHNFKVGWFTGVDLTPVCIHRDRSGSGLGAVSRRTGQTLTPPRISGLGLDLVEVSEQLGAFVVVEIGQGDWFALLEQESPPLVPGWKLSWVGRTGPLRRHGISVRVLLPGGQGRAPLDGRLGKETCRKPIPGQ